MALTGLAATVEILNLSNGVSTPLGSILANSTAWSPNENVIAYNANGIISTIHPDGTGQTALTGAAYEKIDLISVTTPHLMDSPTWH
jgi:hypothetical protein